MFNEEETILMIKKSYYNTLLKIPSLLIVGFYATSQESLLSQNFLTVILLVSFFVMVREQIIPIAKIENKKIYVFFSAFKKPIVLNIEEIKKIRVHKRGYFPVHFEFILDIPSNIISLDYHMLSSKSVEFYELIKENVKQCEFDELEYVEPEDNSLFSKIFNRQFSYRSIITFSSAMLLILIVIMVLTIEY